MNNNLMLPIVLQVAGTVVIIAEMLIPSGGLLSLAAVMLLGYSLYLVFTNFAINVGLIFIAADLVIVPASVVIGLKMLAKSSLTLKQTLSKEKGVQSQAPDLENYVGKEGFALSNLRPSGTAKIEGKRLDVVSRGDYIEKNSEIIVHSVTGNQIIVIKKSVHKGDYV